MTVGDLVTNIAAGKSNGNFGWLTWAGQNDAQTLAASLIPPGNSYTYVNPRDPNDRVISTGDWIQGVPGANNARAVRDALDLLKTVDILIPVWNATDGQGANFSYRVSDFANVRLVDYHLSGKETISVRFLGHAICGIANLTLDHPRLSQESLLRFFMPMIVR